MNNQENKGLARPDVERGACGVGFVARLDASPRHEVVTAAVQALINLEHRGAVGGDKSTGDGAGILLRLPDALYREECARTGFALPPRGDYATGLVFLPVDPDAAARAAGNYEETARREGCEVLGWREVPVDPRSLGDYARRTQPAIRQIFLARNGVPRDAFERKLLVVRRLTEKAFGEWSRDDTSQFYAPSLSSRSIVYKGLMTGSQLPRFYPDLVDPRMASPYALVHQRYSTNTLPTWTLAQPFRYLAHNGEINTLHGNLNQMKAREADLRSPLFGADLERLRPVLVREGSDSAIFDNMLELLVLAGRSLPHAIMMMVPEAWQNVAQMSADKRAFYEYHSALMEPWDGPAALMFCDDRYIGATLDRNGLRPARYTVTTDGLVVMASETGVLEIEPERILSRGQLQPGRMFLVDLEQKRIVPDQEVKAKISRARPYRLWLKQNRIELDELPRAALEPEPAAEHLRRLHLAFGYSDEEIEMILAPMAAQGQEPIGSMGNDAALAVLSERPQLLYAYFKQLFAQVTNPPIDPLREEFVMSLMGWLGTAGNLLAEVPEHCQRLRLTQPILTPENATRLRQCDWPEVRVGEADMLFTPEAGKEGLVAGLENLCRQAEEAIAGGARLLLVTDRRLNALRAAIPALLATSNLHHHLIWKGLRNRVGLIVETAEAREVAHHALLIGYGANAVCPYGAMATVARLAREGLLENVRDPDRAVEHYITALKKGLLKTFSRMGISTLRSYCGSQLFEAVGLAGDFVDRYFHGTASRVGGIRLEHVAAEAAVLHRRAFPLKGEPPKLLDVGGRVRLRVGGERHLWTPEAICHLQHAVRHDDYGSFKKYSALIHDRSLGLATLRGLFRFKPGAPIPLAAVEPETEIVKRFVSAAMSYGSISKEAHESIALAMNRLGGKSNSGEGGEDAARFAPLPNGDSLCSAVKQVASGRFGVTTEYLLSAKELQIKIAQGAKPGEGGQLPGHKVSVEIARVRHTTPGVTLISPPPHHDIYSIEDLAQLIYDLKCVNPLARVSVKLVSEVGVGTVATGVAKARADVVLIAGHDGGTGASPLTSILHAGTPWELGLAETQQALLGSDLRDRIRIQVDGQLKTGRDLAIAALMGAEEFGFGTTLLVSLGCVMMRKCHTDTCPVGVATQNETLRSRFAGKPEHVERFLIFIARELREYMAELGFRTVDDMVGRVECLETADALDHWKVRGLDFSALLAAPASSSDQARRFLRAGERSGDPPLDDELIALAAPALEQGRPVRHELPIRNVHRTVGARLSGAIVSRYGAAGLPEETIRVRFTGSAGQSFGAFLAPGVSFHLSGDANDYVGKGMSGGRIAIAPHPDSSFPAHESAIVGNTVLYGATGGELYLAGAAGTRFAVRNSGARAVVEGVGDHACEYMTGGVVVVLGLTGLNFAAGMSGGIAYVFDETQLFDTRCNLDMVELETVWQPPDQKLLRTMLENHVRHTGSVRAQRMLAEWESHLPLFVKVMPVDYRQALARIRLEEEIREDAVSATEEVFNV
ncbi:MAG: glutamate synthase large subunit [Myxococcales bacterium]|nr:glutamate synthase large subunit [Myxococcales bacterium]